MFSQKSIQAPSEIEIPKPHATMAVFGAQQPVHDNDDDQTGNRTRTDTGELRRPQSGSRQKPARATRFRIFNTRTTASFAGGCETGSQRVRRTCPDAASDLDAKRRGNLWSQSIGAPLDCPCRNVRVGGFCARERRSSGSVSFLVVDRPVDCKARLSNPQFFDVLFHSNVRRLE